MTDFHFKKMETKAVSKDVIFYFLENSFFMSISSLQIWKDGATQSRENLSDASLSVKLPHMQQPLITLSLIDKIGHSLTQTL